MQWQNTVERAGQCLLISSYFYVGQRNKYWKKLYVVDSGFSNARAIEGQISVSKRDFENCRKFLRKQIGKNGAKWLHRCIERSYVAGRRLLEFSERINELDATTLPNGKLKALFSKFGDLTLNFAPALYLPILIEPIVEEKLRQSVIELGGNEQDYVALIQTSKMNEEAVEILDFLELKEKTASLQNAGLQDKLVNNHLKKYAWLGCVKYSGKPWNKNTIRSRLSDLEGKKWRSMLKEARQKQSIIDRNAKTVMNRLGMNGAERELVKAVRELAYFRTQRLGTFNKSGHYARNLFEEIAQRNSLSYEQLISLTYDEILQNLFTSKLSPSFKREIANRTNWGVIFDCNRIRVLSGEELAPYIEKMGDEEVMPNAISIRGATACGGVAKGTAKIIKQGDDFRKFNDGDIIVSPMTTPDFVPIMQTAAAIITDEGGITCHAAIVSRELNIPCIIGTKIATKVLKDGDLIEVDAYKGIVRKLKK